MAPRPGSATARSHGLHSVPPVTITQCAVRILPVQLLFLRRRREIRIQVYAIRISSNSTNTRLSKLVDRCSRVSDQSMVENMFCLFIRAFGRNNGKGYFSPKTKMNHETSIANDTSMTCSSLIFTLVTNCFAASTTDT